MSRKKLKIEFSKLIFWVIFSLTIFVVLFACALMWKTGDTSGLAYLIPSMFAALSAEIVSYSWKARTENRIKLLKKYGLEIDKSDIETIERQGIL